MHRSASETLLEDQVHIHDLEFKAVDTFSYLNTLCTFQRYVDLKNDK